MVKYKDMAGQTFGRLTANAHTGKTPTGQAIWLFDCACGGVKTAQASAVRRGKIASCGCLAIEQKQAAGRKQSHPYSRTNMPRVRKPWENMISRCYTPSNNLFHRYGARGITVCDEWRDSFQAFADDMGERPEGTTLDRINNDLGYGPENCRWIDMAAQGNNRGNNHWITINGESKTISQWARHVGTRPSLINTRIYKGWSEHDAVLIPLGGRRG